MKLFIVTAFALSFYCVNGQAIDSVAIKQVDSLVALNRELVAKNQFEHALTVIDQAEQVALGAFGRESVAMGKCLHNHARTFQNWGKTKDAEPFYLEAIAIREKVLGKENPEFANSLNNLANLYLNLANYEKAEALFLEAIHIREKVLGKQHTDYTGSLTSLAIVYSIMGKYEKAEPLFLETKTICEQMFGKEHPDYASSINNLGTLYKKIGKFEKAEPLYLESKAINEKVFGKEHPEYANSLINLGVLYHQLGADEKAEPLYIEAKAIKGKVQGKEHPDYAGLLYNQANLYMTLGQYQKAEPLLFESKAIMQKIFGKEHPEYANSLNSLANLYIKIGNYEKAEPLYLESKAINETVFGKEHPEYAASVSNLAILYYLMGQNHKIEQLFLESLAIKGKVLGKEHPEYATTLNDLAIYYMEMGNYEKAEPLLLESKTIRIKVQGKEHLLYLTTLTNLATLYRETGNFTKAEPLYIESKGLLTKLLGKEHPNYVSTLKNLALLYEAQSRFIDSEPFLNESFKLSKSQLAQSTAFLSEQELAKYAATFQTEGNRLPSCLFARHTKSWHSDIYQQSILPSLCYDQSLFQKGFLLTASSRLKNLATASPEAEELNNQLKGYRRRLAAEISKPIAERKEVEVLEEKANATEKELSRTVAGYAEAVRQATWQEVQNTLKSLEVAIEFISFNVNFPKNTDSIMYAALLLKPGIPQPFFIPLFEEKSLDSILLSKGERRLEYVNDLYSFTSRGVSVVEERKRNLGDLIFKPLEKELAGIKTIYYAPSGLLHRINMDAIPITETETFADRYKLIQMNSTRQLVIPTIIKNTTNDAVLFGGIQFNADTTMISEHPIIASRTESQLGFHQTDPSSRGGSWDYLPGTEREVNAIEKIMTAGGIKATLKKGYEGTEEAFKNIGANNKPSPRILHIATHGYFFPDPKANSKTNPLSDNESVFKISDHPMLRSGLIMAGGNNTWKGEKTLEGREDGVLTAYEISQMNLSNTELVVLSACETGLGTIQGNEGVYGLQRAFKIAGAKYLIMSLWQVPDKQTSLLMTTFYKRWFENKMTIPDAFHAAQKDLREVGLDPYYWAGFVLVE